MILCEDNYPEILDEICAYLTKSEVELVFVDEVKMREINLRLRKINKATDVLSFPLCAKPHMPLGSVVINLDEVGKQALVFGHTDSDECALLFIHGMLHLLGFDHETDSGQMRMKEGEVITKFNLPKSLIIRNEEF